MLWSGRNCRQAVNKTCLKQKKRSVFFKGKTERFGYGIKLKLLRTPVANIFVKSAHGTEIFWEILTVNRFGEIRTSRRRQEYGWMFGKTLRFIAAAAISAIAIFRTWTELVFAAVTTDVWAFMIAAFAWCQSIFWSCGAICRGFGAGLADAVSRTIARSLFYVILGFEL